MNLKIFNVIETSFNALGIIVAVQDIYNWLGILLLVINIFAILFRGALEIYNHIKDKDYNKAIDTIEDIRDNIEDEINSHKEEK